MTKNELIEKIKQQNPEFSSEKAREVVNAILEKLTHTLSQNRRVECRGFGSFSVRIWGPRFARHPETGHSWRTQESKAVYFRPAKEVRERVQKRSPQKKQKSHAEIKSEICEVD